MPASTPTAAALKTMDPEDLIENIPQEAAEQIVSEWRAARETPGLPKANDKSVKLYRENTKMLELKYSRDNNVDIGVLSPVDIIKNFFIHSRALSPETWKLYRAGFLHTMNERAIEFAGQDRPQPTLIRALASLIVVSGKPYNDERPPTIRGKRTKSLPARDFDRIITHLATAYSEQNRVARRAQSFAMATIATGLRPIEWLRASLRQATEEEVPKGESPASWLAIDVDTAKRKTGEPDWKRTILVEPGVYQIHVRQHVEAMHAFIAAETGSADPAKNYSRRCSLALRRACEELWPQTNKPGKQPLRVTLYTLRHQARANIASAYGGFVAASMMGHTPGTSQSCYAGKHRANTSSGPRKVRNAGIPVPVPGQNVLAKAQEFEMNPTLMQQSADQQDDDEQETM